MALLETPSRIWRRIEANEDNDMPSLPSLPAFDDSAPGAPTDTTSESDQDVDPDISLPVHSTPALLSHTATSTIRPPGSASSTARFALSIASRNSRSSSGGFSMSAGSSFQRSQPLQSHPPELTFNDVSLIPSLPQIRPEQNTETEDTDMEVSNASSSRPQDLHKSQGEDDDLSLTDALRSLSRSSSPFPPEENPAQDDSSPKKYDYSASLKSESKVKIF
jgi:hypothetical protein